MEIEGIIKGMPSVKMGLDDFYGRQTVLNALKSQQKEIDQLKEELKYLVDCNTRDRYKCELPIAIEKAKELLK